MKGLENRKLAETLIGGLSTHDFPGTWAARPWMSSKKPLASPNICCRRCRIRLYTRDTTCWIYGGVTLNPLYWPARHEETVLTTAIYKFHPDFAGKVNVWWGDPTEDHGLRHWRAVT